MIVSDVEGLTEFLEPGKNGYAFARGSVDDLERVMRQILATPERSRQLNHTANYSKTTLSMTEVIVEIYNAITTKKSIYVNCRWRPPRRFVDDWYIAQHDEKLVA